MKRKILFALVLFVLVLATVITACQAPAPKPATAPTPAPAPASNTSTATIKIGHLRPLTGPMAMVGGRQVNGLDLAIELAGYQVAGRKVEVITEDTAAKPEVAIDKAKETC